MKLIVFVWTFRDVLQLIGLAILVLVFAIGFAIAIVQDLKNRKKRGKND